MLLPRSVLITGASSGLGAALADAYAEPGRRLALGGRNAARLAAVAERCRRHGASVAVCKIDVTAREPMAAWIAAAADGDGESEETAHRRLDLVIANAAISGGTGGDGLRPESGEQTRRIFAANLDGVLNTVLPAIAVMRNQPPLPGSRGIRGQIAIVSSLAGFRGFPGAPAYSASKAAVKAWGEGLRPALARDGIAVSVVCPGFVRTPMTAGNPFPMPFLMEPKRAAAIIRRGLAGNRARIAFPWPLAVVAWLTAALSPAWLDPLLARLPEKPARSGS